MKRRKRKSLRVGGIIRTVGVGADLGVVKSLPHRGIMSVRWLKAGRTYEEDWAKLRSEGAKVVR